MAFLDEAGANDEAMQWLTENNRIGTLFVYHKRHWKNVRDFDFSNCTVDRLTFRLFVPSKEEQEWFQIKWPNIKIGRMPRSY